MSVTRRCPSCGTTQAISGDCQACHEAEVRYYCTNHTPGVWLDGTSCPHCGSRLGAAPRAKSTAPPPPVRRPAPAPVPPRPRGSGAPPPPKATPPFAPSSPPPALSSPPPALSSPPPAPSSPPPAPSPSAWDMKRTTTTLEHAAIETHPARTSPWQLMLEGVLRARAARRAPDRPAASTARGLSGCLLRLLVIAIVLFLALIAALFSFGSALLTGQLPY
jgi:hypothetical protein